MTAGKSVATPVNEQPLLLQASRVAASEVFVSDSIRRFSLEAARNFVKGSEFEVWQVRAGPCTVCGILNIDVYSFYWT